MIDQRNYQPYLHRLFEQLKKEQKEYDNIVGDVRHLFNRGIVTEPEDEESMEEQEEYYQEASPAQLGKQDALSIFGDRLWALSNPIVWEEPGPDKPPVEGKLPEQPNVTTGQDVLNYVQYLLTMLRQIDEYAMSFRATVGAHAEQMVELLNQQQEAK